ncbi:MAG TPA: hypothetical protein VIP11_14480 [Gemmatimonadaceae bacterium]
MRTLVVSAALVFAARHASAQAALSAAKKAAQNAVVATNAHTDAMQRPEAQSQPKAAAPAPKTAAPAPKTEAAPTKPAPVATAKKAASAAASKAQEKSDAAAQTPAGTQAPGTQLDVATADTSSPPPSIMREVFGYAKEGRRDPFVSLLTTSELRPTMSDLRLTTILQDLGGRNSVAILRDVASNTQYRVRVGSTLGRMRVSAIRGLTVLLTIDEFGTTRQDSLVLRDSTKVRKP